jgi:hypothetical protein
MANLITTADPLLADLDYDNLPAAEQAQVDALIAVASEWIEKECNRIFLAATYTDEIQNGLIHEEIFVNNIPLNSVTNVKTIAQATTSTNDVTTTYLSTEILFEGSTGAIRLRNGARWPDGFQNIKITYNGGFSAIPEPIKLLCANLTIFMFSPELLGNLMEKERIGDYFYARVKDFMDKLTISDRKIMTMYKLRKA